MNPEDAEEYTQSLGLIVGGSWRQIAWAARMGVPEALGLSTDEWVQQRLGGYVRLSVSDRREAAKELTGPLEEGGQGMTQREAADVLGVDQATVNRDLRPEPDAFASPDEPDDDFSELEEPEEPEPDAFASPDEPEPERPSKTSYEQRRSTDSNEWYTPLRYITTARRVLGVIDLDPASCEEANRTVQAAEFWTADDDGLAHEWKGNVWLNPPYGGQAGAFVSRLVQHYERREVTSAIALVSALTTDTSWFRQLWNYTLCFCYGRIKFDGNGGTSNTAGSVFVYLGPTPDLFEQEFAQFGAVVERRRPR